MSIPGLIRGVLAASMLVAVAAAVAPACLAQEKAAPKATAPAVKPAAPAPKAGAPAPEQPASPPALPRTTRAIEPLREAVQEPGGHVGDVSFDEGRDLELKGLAGTHRVYRAEWSESGTGAAAPA